MRRIFFWILCILYKHVKMDASVEVKIGPVGYRGVVPTPGGEKRLTRDGSSEESDESDEDEPGEEGETSESTTSGKGEGGGRRGYSTSGNPSTSSSINERSLSFMWLRTLRKTL
jgi:hypothetical protein